MRAISPTVQQSPPGHWNERGLGQSHIRNVAQRNSWSTMTAVVQPVELCEQPVSYRVLSLCLSSSPVLLEFSLHLRMDHICAGSTRALCRLQQDRPYASPCLQH